jgi:hypothetical protein
VLRNGFNTSYTSYGDGKPFFSTTHTRIDGGSTTPVLDAVKAYLLSLPFNGLLVLNRLIRAVEEVEGVVICKIILAQSQYGGGGYTTFTKEVLPDAGYLTLNEDFFNDNITYVAHEPL